MLRKKRIGTLSQEYIRSVEQCVTLKSVFYFKLSLCVSHVSASRTGELSCYQAMLVWTQLVVYILSVTMKLAVLPFGC